MGKFLIDVTDARFSIADNADVIEFIRKTNPFAHSDVGSVLFELRKTTPGAHAYCPVPSIYSYVVLHTDARIFAIAFGMRGLAFRLSKSDLTAALADSGVGAPEIGGDWVRFEPWSRETVDVTRARLQKWCDRACAAALGEVE